MSTPWNQNGEGYWLKFHVKQAIRNARLALLAQMLFCSRLVASQHPSPSPSSAQLSLSPRLQYQSTTILYAMHLHLHAFR